MCDEQRLCIACEREKPISDFSLEHIFPDSMGGALCSDFFKTRHVCRSCNSTMGMFVGGPLIRNWFSKNGEAQAALDFVDIDDNKSWVPLTYMGPSTTFVSLPADEICEIWIGPSGEHVYHIHEKDDPQYDTYVGGNPIARRDDPGRVYMFLTSTDPKWIDLALRSFTRAFKRAQRYAGNFQLQDSTGGKPFVHPPDKARTQELAELQAKVASNGQWHIEMRVAVGFEERFLAKLARSLGFKIFGQRYLETQRARDLKAALWERDQQVRSQLLRGTSFFGKQLDVVAKMAGINGIYTILLLITGGIFSVMLTLPAGQALSVVIADSEELWVTGEFDQYREGILYLVAPPIDLFLGPVSFPEFLAHKLGNIAMPQIVELEKRRKEWAGVPSK